MRRLWLSSELSSCKFTYLVSVSLWQIKKSILVSEAANAKHFIGQAAVNAKGSLGKAAANILGSPNVKIREVT